MPHLLSKYFFKEEQKCFTSSELKIISFFSTHYQLVCLGVGSSPSCSDPITQRTFCLSPPPLQRQIKLFLFLSHPRLLLAMMREFYSPEAKWIAGKGVTVSSVIKRYLKKDLWPKASSWASILLKQLWLAASCEYSCYSNLCQQHLIHRMMWSLQIH